MTDNRCPKCDRIVVGKEEISMGKPDFPVPYCPYCNSALELKTITDNSIGTYFYYGFRDFVINFPEK